MVPTGSPEGLTVRSLAPDTWDSSGRRVAVLCNGTRALFEREGFELVRRKGQRNTVMRKTVASAR